MNILKNQYKILNENLINNINVSNNIYKINFINEIEPKNWNSFGLHLSPNILFKLHNSLNKFNFNLIFNFKMSIPSIIKIYNGIKWLIFDNYNTTDGKFNEILNFDFTKNYWRISTLDIQTSIEISNIQISIVNDEIYTNYSVNKSLLIIGGSLIMSKDFNENDKSLINTFSNNYLYYIKKYFIQKYNFNVCNLPLSETDNNVENLDGLIYFDYCIDINQLGITKKGIEFYLKLKSKIKYDIFSIYDSGINISKNNSNILEKYVFCAIDNFKENKVKHIGWAADEKLFMPKQNSEEKIILIDDCHYNFDRNDSYNVLDYCINLLSKYKNLKIIRFGFYDTIINFKDNYKNKIERYTVIENKISIIKKAEIHNKAWIFFCTHYETLGIPNIESAMSGCLLIYKKGFVNDLLTKDLLKIEYNDINELNDVNIFNKVNFEKQRYLAMNNTWEKLVENIHKNIN